jgi:hypothetical protein
MSTSNQHAPVIIGIDPGTNGSAAIYCAGWGDAPVIKSIDQAKEWANTAMAEWGKPTYVYIEKVQMWRSDEPAKQFVMQKLFRSQSETVGYFKAIGCEVIEVAPQTWQKEHRVKGLVKKDRKNHLKAIAQELWPFTKVNLRNSDALLILHHAINKLK